MTKLFVDKTMYIDAPASRVWAVITQREYTDQWAGEFSSGGPRFHIESDWQFGSPVLWKGEDGVVAVQGNVTAVEPLRLLRFTVFDVQIQDGLPITDEDGITFELSEADGMTTLHVLQGDFSVMDDGELYCQASGRVWDRVLPTIRHLAERKSSTSP